MNQITMREEQSHEVMGPGAEQPGSDEKRLATFDQHRGLLFSVAYRMLGSVADAEDMLQETFIRWQRASLKEIRSPQAFLVTIISRLCINYLDSARVEREEYVGEWLPEPLLTDSASDPFQLVKVDEFLSMAFLVLLERLTPVERAVFLLREVFSYEYAEIAKMVGQNETNCRQILRRARHHVGRVRQRFQASNREHRQLLERFLQATRGGDLNRLINLLSREVVLHSDGGGKALAVPNLIRGSEKVARGVLGSLSKLLPKNLVTRVTEINGKAGSVSYLNGKPYSVLTLQVSQGEIREIYIVTNPEKLAYLPEFSSVPY
jgi:RNA polymerase sigma-70 factor, ECF subfamily